MIERVDVRLGCEVDDRVDTGGRARDRIGISDVAFDEVVLDALRFARLPA